MIHNFMSHAWPLQDIFAKDNNKEIIYNGEGVLSDEEIDSLIQRVDKNVVAGEIDTDEEGKATRIDKRTRDSNVHFLSIEDETNAIFSKLPLNEPVN